MPLRIAGLTRVPRPLWIAVGIAAVALSARLAVPVPGSGVPQSAQTLAVLLVGAFLGARDGALALTSYVLLGALGLPVFSDGASGWAHLIGPTGGYLLGFVLVAGAVGHLADRGLLRAIAPALVVMLCGHVVILVSGWSGLALSLGPVAAFHQGVAPFVVGGILKSIVAAATVVAVAGRTKPDGPHEDRSAG